MFLRYFLYILVMRKEIWMPVLGYEGLYEASNMGRIRSLNYHREGRVVVLSVSHSRKYDRIGLSKNGVVKHYSVHRLVWEAFNGPIPEGMQVNHIDENKRNNSLDNLNLMTPSENHRWGTGMERRYNTRWGDMTKEERAKRKKEYAKEYSKKYAPDYRKKNQEHINELQRKRRAANREEENRKQNEYRKRYRQEHLEEVRAKAREKYRQKKEVA